MGKMFGHYRLEERLGAGGGGEVWRAWDTRLERWVAIKVMVRGLHQDPDSATRFRREAQMAARLKHEHIVRVHSAGEIDGYQYIDMELVDGPSLAEVLGREYCLDPSRVLRIVVAVAAALDRAHGLDGPTEQRMIHRDVKPGNILLEPRPNGREHVYLADFGVARPVEPAVALTASGFRVGTPGYMAPEVWAGRRPDHRIDVYALAVTTFEMLLGHRPFPDPDPDPDPEEVTAETPDEPVPRPSALRPDLPPALDPVLQHGLAKRPEDRYATAGEFAAALGLALSPTVQGPPTPPPTPPAPPEPESEPSPYLASPQHFAGLLFIAGVAPLYLLDLVTLDWALFASAALLYVLGVVLTELWLRRS